MIFSRHTLAHAGAPPFRHGEGRILAKSDAIGLAGLAMLLIGAWFIYSGQYTPPLWVTWIIGPTLWYLGVATIIVWLCWRLFRAKPSIKTGDSTNRWQD
jgi:hypothetical protein